MDDQFRVRYFYTTKGETPSQNEEKEYDKHSPVETIVLWYIARYKWKELQNVIKIPGISITRESDGMKITLDRPEMESSTEILFTIVTDMLMEFAQDYSYTELPVRLRSAIMSVVKSDPSDDLKSEDVVLISDKMFGLVGHKELLDDTKKVLLQRAGDLQVWQETVDIQPAHEELVEKLCIIEALKQKHQVQIGLQRILNVSGTKGNVEKCVAEYNSMVSGIKPEGQSIPQTWVDLLNNKEVQDYILEELRRGNIRCVWRVDEHECKVLVYSLDSKTSREACTIICESVGERTYSKEMCTNQEVQSLLNRYKSLLKIFELDGTLCIVGVRKIMESIDDVVKHQSKMQETHQQVKTGNTGGSGHCQIVYNETGKCQQDRTGDTDEVGYSMAQAPCDDGELHTEYMDPNAAMLEKKQLSSLEQQLPAASRQYSHRIHRSNFNVLQNLEMREMVDRRLQEAQLKCQWQVKTKGSEYYLEIVSDNHIVIRDLILQTAERHRQDVSIPVSGVTEVRLHIDNDRLIYIQEHQKEVLNNISERYGVIINLENSDEFVITGEREYSNKARRELMTICKGINCSDTEVEAGVDLHNSEVTAKLRNLERKERCIIEFPRVHQHEPRCLHSWMYFNGTITITITCGPVESYTAEVIVLPVDALGNMIGDSDYIRQLNVYQSQVKSQFTKEKILFQPNSSTLNCLTIALAYVPEWTHESQIDDGALKKFKKLLKYAIVRSIGSVVIPVDITEGFPFSSFGCKLASRLVGKQWDLNHRLEIFLCTKTVYNGYLLKSKLTSPVFRSDQDNKIIEVLFGIERHLEICRDWYPAKAIQIHIESHSMISMQSKVDVMVHYVGRKLDLSEGYVSKSLLQAGGRAIQDECTQNYPDGICYGDVAVTGPGKLQCKMLCHGAILRTRILSGNFSIRVLKSMLRKCLVEMDKRQYKTIAIPAVGTGTPGYPYNRVAEAMFDVVEEYQRDHQNTCITDVFFVIHQDDKKTLQAFEFQEKRKRKRPKHLLTAVKDDQPVEYIESFLPELQLRFQIFQHTDFPVMNDRPEAVVTFNNHGNTDPVLHKWNMDGNYLDITAKIDGTDDTFKKEVKEILNITEENRITSVAFHLDLMSFATKSPVQLAEFVREIVLSNQSFFSQSTKPVFHYIRQIQFVVYNNTDIRSYIPRGVTGIFKSFYTYPLEWHFVSYTFRSNHSCRVLAEDLATVKRVQDEVRRLIKQQQRQEQGDNMREEALSVPLGEEDYNAFRFFAAPTSWFRAVENSVKWEAGTLCIKHITDKYKQKVSQLVEKINEMSELDYPLTDDDLKKARDKCSEVQKEFQDVYLSCKLQYRNVIIRSSCYEINLKVKYKLDLAFGRIQLRRRNKRFDIKEAVYIKSTQEPWSRKDDNVPPACDITRDYKTGGEGLYRCLQEIGHSKGVYRTKEGILVKVYSGSIANLPVDCIVNAANEQLAHGGGVAYAISRAAGYDFDRESREYVQKYGQLRVAECCSTTAGNLPYKCVIHTVGPRWHDYRDKAQCLSDLQQSVEVTFKEAERMQLSSIAVPPISSGIFGVPKTDCAEQYYRAIVSYSQRHGQTSSLKEIHIIDIDTNMMDLIQRTFSQMLSSYDQTTAKLQVPNAQGNMDTSVTSRRGKSFPAEHDYHNSESSKQVDDRRANPDIEDCCICMDTPTDPKTLPKCGHTFCTDCIDQYFKVKPVCPNCGQVYGKVTGDQPDGHMYMSRSYSSLPGYESCRSIRVTYRFPDGTQGPDHPSPGQRYKGFERSGHLPDNEKGRLAAKLLNVAFTRRLVFTIGRSRTTGQDGVLTWNDIHHKTRTEGGPGAFGYPDATYLDLVLDELAVKGVTPESSDDPEEYREYTRCFRY